MKPFYIVLFLLILSSFLTVAILYPSLPDQIPSHWNAAGEVDGYLPKFWGLFLFPFILTGLVLLFLVIPRIDPLRANILQFLPYYEWFVVIFALFLLSLQATTILWAYGILVPINTVMSLGIGILFFYIGILLGHARRNWFIGIRTPWTLSSNTVWKKTHRLGSVLFMVAGLIALLGTLFPAYAIWLILVPVLALTGITVVYSYLLYEEMRRKGMLERDTVRSPEIRV
jgi:uncharacterized membrane protein